MILLSPRQNRIVLDLYNAVNHTLNIDDIAQKYKLTRRTIQNDLSTIREETEKHGINIKTKTGGFIVLTANEEDLIHHFIEHVIKKLNSTNEFSSMNSRVNYIISLLINDNHYIKSSDLAELMYVSQSTISNDLKSVRKVLQKYELCLESKPGYGLKLVGDEKHKRLCLIKEGIIGKPILTTLDNLGGRHQETELNVISDIITNVFLKHEYSITEIVLQNLVVHVHVAVLRIKNGHVIKEYDVNLPTKYHTAFDLAQEIMTICSDTFNITYSEAEVIYLTLNIFGKKEFEDEYFISGKTTQIIDEALEKIKHTYHIDLTNEIDLKVSLGLHLTPLIIRVENDIQFENLSMLNIKQLNPLAYNIATDFFSYIFPNFKDFTEDEINYVAIHFMNFVENKMSKLEENNILIISSYRVNDTFLMRQKIIRNIPNINEIDVIDEKSWITKSQSKYSAIITAEEEIAAKYENVKLVNFFLSENDIKKIEFALTGLRDLSDITNKFNKNLFIRDRFKDKNSVQNKLIQLVEHELKPGKEFAQSVIRHEHNTPSSYFGNGIAILHPDEPVTDVSFIAVALLNNPVKWDYEASVETVLLVSIAKNKPHEFALWNWLSEFISDAYFSEIHSEIIDFEKFIEYIEKIYKQII